MQGTGTTYAVSGETTEWEDILIQKGIRSKEEILIEKGLNPADFEEKVAPTDDHEELDLQGRLEKHITTMDEIDELEDDEEFSDNRILNEYRQKRLDELKKQQVLNRFGDVTEITRDEWLPQVNDGSKSAWVVVHLYQDSVIECRLLDEILLEIAKKFKYIKFLKIKSTQAIENWPDRNLPSLFCYHNGELQTQLLTLKDVGGKSMKLLDLEWWLVQKDIVTSSELQEDPRNGESSLDNDDSGNRKITNAGRFAKEVRRNNNNDDDDNEDD